MTGLEAIAEKLEEAKKQQLEDILSVSGSNAMSKNEYINEIRDCGFTGHQLTTEYN